MNNIPMERLNPGGLMRCCTGTFLEKRKDFQKSPAKEGDVLPCQHCDQSLIFRAGAWEWNRKEDTP